MMPRLPDVKAQGRLFCSRPRLFRYPAATLKKHMASPWPLLMLQPCLKPWPTHPGCTLQPLSPISSSCTSDTPHAWTSGSKPQLAALKLRRQAVVAGVTHFLMETGALNMAPT